MVQSGIVGMGIDPVSASYSYQSFTIPPKTQRLTGTLFWFGGPTRDLDFTLLDSDSNAVGSSASTANPEVITVSNLPAGTYIWRVLAFTNPDTAHYTITTDYCVDATMLSADPRRELDFAMALAPNPCHVLAAITFALPQSGHASLKLYDVSGRLIRTLQDGPLAAGRHVRVWDRSTNGGAIAPGGVYFARLESAGRALSRKLVMVR